MFYWFLKYLLGPLVNLFWISKVEGLHNVPKDGPIILAANHSSYFDFITIIATCPRRVTFLAAEVFYKSWFWKPLMLLTGQIKVDRTSKDKSFVYEASAQILRQGDIFGIFPEGKRSRNGRIQKAYTGVAKIAKENNVGIVPVSISGAYEVMSPHDKFPKFKKIIHIQYLEPVYLDDKMALEEVVHKNLMPIIANNSGQSYEY